MIGVLVVDSDHITGRELADILRKDRGFRVMAAPDHESALDSVKEKKPDVVVLGIDNLVGLDILHDIMQSYPTPVIIVSSSPEDSITAFRYGCVDCIQKTERIDDMSEELNALVKVAASAEVRNSFPPREDIQIEVPKESNKVVVIAASTGGPTAIEMLISQMPAEFPCGVVVVQHLPPVFTRSLARRLNKVCRLRVKEAEQDEHVERGKVLVAPGGMDLEFKGTQEAQVIEMSTAEPGRIAPSIDKALTSAAEVIGENCIAVILTGMGRDGAHGAGEVHRKGGKVIAQDKSTSCVYGMPKAVAVDQNADYIVPLFRIGETIAGVL